MDNLIYINSRAERELKRLDKTTKTHIVTVLLAFIDDPRPLGCLKVRTSEGLWRIRVDDLRVGYEIDDAPQEVTIVHHLSSSRTLRLIDSAGANL